MTTMRAKMRITQITPYPADGEPTQETLTFNAVAKNTAYPADGFDEDNTFAKFTPAGLLTLTVANPALIGEFEVGDIFYLDFVPVE